MDGAHQPGAELGAQPPHVGVDGPLARAVDSHVRGLRAKLGAGLVRTVHGVGYALEA